MKLIYCPMCQDIFKLDPDEMRQCKCGDCKGKYDDNGHTAVTNGVGQSIAIGNGSLYQAIASYNSAEKDGWITNKDDSIRHGQIHYAWIRGNDGPSNPRSRVEPDL